MEATSPFGSIDRGPQMTRSRLDSDRFVFEDYHCRRMSIRLLQLINFRSIDQWRSKLPRGRNLNRYSSENRGPTQNTTAESRMD
ncbi:hypothetical protein RB10927 [Rhodopirellula baltica SH 1]|uniref:Uncharacterized protein n=1 Tax=Rhodopirellula baltica (strain DSM 10527 / NCIMB 13988 / SH1) TaxID=243090 RepID=Q7UK12_RHOBA|nr:hypothetical protein RB10927 [Rhodopirellula baltica SH 1]